MLTHFLQANPLNTRSRLTPSFTSRGILAADAPLTVPMLLRLSSFQLSGIIILVFSKQKGLTLVFRNDPVDSVKVSSTFDSISVIQRFLQSEIERLLKDLMREEVPAIIHKLSLEWAMRNQADECLSPASLTNTQSDNNGAVQNFSFPLDLDTNGAMRPIFSAENLEKLSQLSVAQHTLSPFTAYIPQSVFRSSTALVPSVKYPTTSSSRRQESQNSEFPFHQKSDISPPESVFSTQSTDASLLRPTLYGRRQRSSYLRRPHPPKRKVVRLTAHSETISETESVAGQSTSSAKEADYYSEPGGYQSYQEYSRWGSGKDASMWSSRSYVKGWENKMDKIADTSGFSEYLVSNLKETSVEAKS